ncbi:MAG TPA: DUF6599 family protein [Bacteroidales bacterium]|nr:DUF6599 family protein [Bacteroidales bacterium]
MKKPIVLLIVLTSGLFLSLDIRATDVYNLFPDEKGWEKSLNYSVYTPDDLWDYIDGAADAYLLQGFVDLHIAEYTNGKQNIRVEIYQHKDVAHGFGIYSQERSPDLNFIDIGEKGYQQGSVLNFLNGRYYVKIYASSEKNKVVSTMEDIARQLSHNINPKPALPHILSMFPEEGHLPHRDAFISQSFMGHAFLNSVYKASYKSGDNTFSLFIIKEMNAAACEQILRQYLEFTKQPTDKLSQGKLLIKDPYNGPIDILWKDNWIFGLSGTDNRNIEGKYLDMLAK